MAKKVTMQQIADQLGVSKFVVSKALSGKGGVSEATRERVIHAASQLGYFNQQKTALKQDDFGSMEATNGSGKQSVAVMMPNIRFQNKDSLYWGRILDGISAKLEEAGLGILILSEQSIDFFLDMVQPSKMTGLIGVGVISSQVLLEAHRMGFRMVLVDHEDPLIPTDTVFANNYDCMRRLTGHLIGTGHRRLHFIGSESFSRSFFDRYMGFRAALEEQGLADLARGDCRLALEEDPERPYSLQIRAWAESRKGELPTAMVCANDYIAFCTVRVLEELGIRVPEDVSVTGFDNIENAAQFQPPLTTVNVPKEVLGRRAVEKLMERVQRPQEPMEKLLLAGDILYRGSTSPRGGSPS